MLALTPTPASTRTDLRAEDELQYDESELPVRLAQRLHEVALQLSCDAAGCGSESFASVVMTGAWHEDANAALRRGDDGAAVVDGSPCQRGANALVRPGRAATRAGRTE